MHKLVCDKKTPGRILMTLRREVDCSRRRSWRFVVFGLAVAIVPSPSFADDQTINGHWHGQIATPVKSLDIDVAFSPAEEGSWQGHISIPAQGSKDLPLGKIEVKGAEVSFEISNVPGMPAFKGTLEEHGKKITGTFAQSGQSFSFHLDRAADPVALARAISGGL